jgi:hypothetical protein
MEQHEPPVQTTRAMADFGEYLSEKGKRRPLAAGQYLDLLREKLIFSR